MNSERSAIAGPRLPGLGPPVTPERLAQLIEGNDQRLREHAKEAIDLCFESELFSRKIGVTREELREMDRAGKVLSFDVGAVRFYASWQIKDGKLLEGMEDVLKRQHFTDTAHFTRWATEYSSADLNNKTIVQCLQDGEVETVLSEIEYLNNSHGM